MSDTKKTLIDEGTEFKGTLTSSSAIVVMGRVEGQMTGPSVEVTETGVLSGKAKVTELRSRGELAGEFDAEIVELSGRVRDKTIIRAKSLEISLQRSEGRIEMVFGECELAVGDAPDKAKAVREATAAPQSKAAKAPAASAEIPAPGLTPATKLPAEGGGGEVAAEADASPSAKLARRSKRTDSERQPEGA